MIVIHWFRRDLRLNDSLALHTAAQTGATIVPLFVFDGRILRAQRAGAARLAFLLAALRHLDARLRANGSRLLVRSGDPLEVIPALVTELGATALYFNRDYSPYARQRDTALAQRLTIPVYGFDDAVLLPPGQVMTAEGQPYTVYTPFRRNWNAQPKPAPVMLHPAEVRFHPLADVPGEPLPEPAMLGFAPVALPLPAASEAAAEAFLQRFVAHDLVEYDEKRNLLPINPFAAARPTGTSYLSPYLRLGLLAPRQAYQAARTAYAATGNTAERASIETWVSELTWRDFYIHILYHFPHVLERDFKDTYRDVAWSDNTDHLQAWQAGQTGYPIVDAPMRQLQAIGWMPNRARMIVASFLTKDLLIHWRAGDLYFMRHLLDGDPAANNGGWQWAAGTGTDAQPYFRIFNPVAQSKQYAPPAYLRHWLPELDGLPDQALHAPWEYARPPRQYPQPIVDHAAARARTLAAFKLAVKGQAR